MNDLKQWVFDPSSNNQELLQACGGKARGLFALGVEGMPVPYWTALSHQACAHYLEHGPGPLIEGLLAQRMELGLGECAARILQVFLEHPLSPDQKLAWLPQGNGLFAVRSSALGEDQAEHSFAGQHTTLLGQKPQDLERALLEVWASAMSERALSYRCSHNLPCDPSSTGVIFQQQIESQWSGVLFNCDPVQRHSAHFVLHSIQGLGEAYVSGAAEGDEYKLHPRSGEILEHKASQQECWMPVAGALQPLQSVQSLPEEAVLALWNLTSKWEKIHPGAWDFEWAYAQGKIYVLQVRPLSTWVENPLAPLFLWDNSNIVESYGGLTLPLTFSFARRMYHAVYVQFCILLGLSPKGLRAMESTLRNMLGLIQGRVYYNLFHWYRLTGLLPFYKANRSFMETMMGTGKALEEEIASATRPLGGEGSPSRYRSIRTGLNFLRGHFDIQARVDRFLSWFHHHYEEALEIPFDSLDATQALRAYEELENRFAHSWQTPILNDFLCMVHFGIFRKLCGSYFPDHSNLHNDLLAGSGNLESAQPTRVLLALAEKLRQDPKICTWILEHSDKECAERWILDLGPADAEFKAEIHAYLRAYGFRCMSEMKLEQPDLHQEPSQFFAFLRNLLHERTPSLVEIEERENSLRQNALEIVAKSPLSWWKKALFRWSTHHAKKAVRNRENTRFCRTRIYGIARRLFVQMGQDLVRRGLIDKAQDLFYLELEEIRSSLEGTWTLEQFRPLIALRKAQYAEWQKVEPPKRIWTRGPVTWAYKLDGDPLEPSAEGEGLRGQGCCPGIVEGRIKIVLESTDDLRLGGEILVTKRTDPGWIPLYPALSGLLVERGGLLSHSAIVAREMGLPTIVNIPGLCQNLRDGMLVRMDGQNGTIEILSEEEE